VATLDYAVLAEYARIDSAGLITIVGGGFDRVRVSGESGVQQLFVALRILTSGDEDRVPFEVKVRAPGGQYEIVFAGVTERAPSATPSSSGTFSFTAAVGMAAPLPVAGEYVVDVLLAGDTVRSLPFVVTMSGAAD
jgi:hypothetical protein